MKLLFVIFGEGWPMVLGVFPLNSLKKSILNWVHGFHKVLEAFLIFFLCFFFEFWEGGGPGCLAN